MQRRLDMTFAEKWKWVNRHGASPLGLLILLGFCAMAHYLAFERMEFAQRQFAFMDAKTIQRMAIIDFIHNHLWLVTPYALVFLGSLLWLEIRSAPRWAIWVSFLFLALPCSAYVRGCIAIFNKFVVL